MQATDHSSTRGAFPWVAALAVLLPLLAMLRRGMDANWDLRNYHLYDPHAWLHGRTLVDIAPAQLQSFHNPLLDVPLYLLVSSGAPAWLSGLWLVLPTIACLLLLLRLQRQLSCVPPTAGEQLALLLLSLGGAATWSMLATSMNDPFVAAAMLGSLVLVLGELRGERPRNWAIAGLLAGAMAGLKLSASFYCVALAVAALVGAGWRSRLARTAALAAGGMAGFALTYGYWGWRLLREYANPVFPYFNHLFGSPHAPASPWTDDRFKPHGAWDALTSPFQLLAKTQHYSEPAIRDPRLLAGLLCLLVLAVLAWRRQSMRRSVPTLRLLAFFVVAWLLWVHQYGIYRYAMTLELLGALALVLALQWLPRWRAAALVLAVVLVNADTRRPDWGHAPWAPRAGIVDASLPRDSLVVTAADEPLAYLALGLPDEVPMLGLANNLMSPDRCSRMQARAEARLARHRGPVFLLAGAAREPAQAVLQARYGLRPAGECVAFLNALAPAVLCPQIRSAWRPSCTQAP